MKKILIAMLMLISVIALQNASSAEEVGVGDIVFEENVPEIVEHGFLMNELSYNVIRLHLSIAGKDIALSNYEGEALTTIKRLEELTRTDIIEVLNISINKEEALVKYLSDCYQELQK